MLAAMAACSGGPAAQPIGTERTVATSPVPPPAFRFGAMLRPRPAWYRQAPAAIRRGVYIAEYYDDIIRGYDWQTRKNLPPICDLPGSYVINVATDSHGNLIDPDGGTRSVIVYKGPQMCGKPIGGFADADGQPSDAATSDAASGTIYVGNILATGQPYGDVSICTLAAGCTGKLADPAIGGPLFAVALDANANVYASGYATAPSGGAALVVWKNGKTRGKVIGGYRNAFPGGLDVDKNGNILAVDTFAGGEGALWVYSGCPDACVASGPFPLKGESVFGRVDSKGNVYEAADFEYGQVDVYAYHGTSGITYAYSYNDGMIGGDLVEGIALDPAGAP